MLVFLLESACFAIWNLATVLIAMLSVPASQPTVAQNTNPASNSAGKQALCITGLIAQRATQLD